MDKQTDDRTITINGEVLNKYLSDAPADPSDAENYDELYSLWNKLHALQESGQSLSPQDFSDWEARVMTLLRPHERERFLRPLSPHLPLSAETVEYARKKHLTKILWARQGYERHMSDTGD